MSEIFSAFNSERPYETPPHAHEEFMFLIPERGVMRFTDEETNRSTTLARPGRGFTPRLWGLARNSSSDRNRAAPNGRCLDPGAISA